MHTQFYWTVFIYNFLIILPQSLSLSLYSSDDPLYELDSSNFESVILRKSNAWIIEFYNNWCGHCIRFAPTWKQFSKDIKTWRNVIDVAVVNCADSHNIKLCRDYDVTGYPTIKLFKPYVNESDKGDPLNGDRDIESIETTIVDYLESYQEENAPADWPDFHPLENIRVRELPNLLTEDQEDLIVFVEHPNCSLGKKVIMDFSFQNNIVVKRVLRTNEAFINELKFQALNSSLATVIKINKNKKQELIARFSPDMNSSYVRDKIFFRVFGKSRSESELLLGSKSNYDIKVSNKDSVHMTDLENALRYLLYQEIGVVKHIYGDRLEALKSFIHTLKNYFPGRPPIMSYLSKITEWVSNQRNITGEKFVQELDNLQQHFIEGCIQNEVLLHMENKVKPDNKTENEYLPEMKDFIGCKGSEPRYRGYPCSLWTLFHTLTVQAYITDEKTAGGLHDEVMSVLPNIKSYIKYFFTCEECVQNFFKMDQDIERDANTSSNVVLWLWSAHNRVNHRLSGDITEDPQHPKIQFPSPDMCASCRLQNEDSNDVKWDEIQVLRFLRHFYGKQNIVISDTADSDSKARHHSSFTSGKSSMVISLKNVSFYEKWSFEWFTNTDISLCVSLYLVSALLLIFIFLLFRQRRRKKKSQIFKYTKLYP